MNHEGPNTTPCYASLKIVFIVVDPGNVKSLCEFLICGWIAIVNNRLQPKDRLPFVLGSLSGRHKFGVYLVIFNGIESFHK